MNKEEITVSAEVKTYLMNLYSQIEYELQEQYNDEVQKLQQENEELKNIIEKLKKLIEVNTYTENIYLGFCYLLGDYDYEDLPTKIKEVLKEEK